MKAMMFAVRRIATGKRFIQHLRRDGIRRLRMGVALFATAVLLGACGGGADVRVARDFNIGVTVGGQFLSNTSVAPGGSLNLAIRAGESLILDAGEPAVWTLFVGGTAVSGGAQVFYAGANITATTLNPSAVNLSTYAAFPLQASIPITLIATSSYDSVDIATVNLLITN